MKVERSSLDQVKKRFELNKRKEEDKKAEYNFDERIKELKEEVHYCLSKLSRVANRRPAGRVCKRQQKCMLIKIYSNPLAAKGCP